MFEGMAVVRDGEFCRIGWDFFGEYTTSRGQHYLLAWSQNCGMEAETKTGEAPGIVLLASDHIVRFSRPVNRPECGKVTDSGVSLINDLIDFREGCKGALIVHDANGNRLMSKRFRANLGCNGISEDGSLCACQTFHADNEDGDRVHVVRVSSGQVLFSTERHLGWADKIDILPSAEEVRLVYRDGYYLTYNFEGKLINESVFDEICRQSSGYSPDVAYNALCLQYEMVRSGEMSFADNWGKIVGALVTAIDNGLSDVFMARAFRMIGELQLQAGQDQAALASLERALAIDKRIGVKRLVSKLRTKVTLEARTKHKSGGALP